MRLVKSATISLLTRSFKRGDEVAIIAFRGTSTEVVLEPTSNLADTFTLSSIFRLGVERLWHMGLHLASHVTLKPILILMTDGRANSSIREGDPWQDALDATLELKCAILVVDTRMA